MTKCITTGFSFTLCIYLLVAFFGYWTFPNLTDPATDQNLINLYEGYVPMLIVQILLALYVLSIIPLFAHAFRKSLCELIHAHRLKKVAQSRKVINEFSQSHSHSDEDGEEDVDAAEILEDAVTNAHLAWVPTSPEAERFVKEKQRKMSHVGGNGNGNGKELELPTVQHATVTLLFLASVVGVAIFAQNIGQVNSILSSTMLPIVCYIFPWLCTLKTKRASRRMRVLTGFMAMFSVLNAGLFFYDLFTGNS